MNDNSKRLAMAIVLSVIVTVMYMNMFVPKPIVNNQNLNNVQATSQASVNQANVANNQVANQNLNINNVNNNNANSNSNPVQVNNNVEKQRIPTLEELREASKKFITNVAEIEISELGGRIISYKLRKYHKAVDSQELVELIDVKPNGLYPLALIYDNGKRDDLVKYSFSLNSNNVNKIDENTFEIQGDAQIVLTSDADNLKKVITLKTDSYLFDVSFPTLSNTDNAWIEWNNALNNIDVDRYNEFSILYLLRDKKTNVDSINSYKLPSDYAPIVDLGDNIWLSAGYKYFANILIPQATGNNTRYGVVNGNLVLQGKLSSESRNIRVYAGPRDKDILVSEGYSLEKSINFGFFTFIAAPLHSVLKFFYKILGNYGLAIILLTLVIKLLFLPLTSTSIKSMKKMSDLQPKMQELRNKYGKDPAEMQRQTMELYKKYNVNPLSGCIPIFIQIPVFFGLYSALLNSIDIRQAPFALWITDLSVKEELHVFGIGVPVMILLMGLSMFIQQLTTPTVGDPAQRKAMLITPIIFTVIFIVSPFPSGLVLYWLTNNLISIVQQKVLKAEGDKISPLKGTLIGSAVIYGLAYILTLL